MELHQAKYLSSIELNKDDALIAVDIQNDFLPGGALAAQDGDKIIDGVNQAFDTFHKNNLPIVFTQDWHPEGHHSFASVHEGKNPFDPYEAPGLGPVLWPDHCVQGTEGSEFADGLNTKYAQTIVRKGYNKPIDSYSGFLENDHKTETGLDGYLNGRDVKRIFVCGLAFDYCVYFTAADGAKKGYEVVVLTDLTQPVGSPEGSIDNAKRDMENQGVQFSKLDAINAVPQ